VYYYLFFLHICTKYNNEKHRINLFVLSNASDSALFYLAKIKDETYSNSVRKILKRKETLEELSLFTRQLNLSGRFQYELYLNFLNDRLHYPKETKQVNTTFTAMKQGQIHIIANQFELADANEENERFKNYLAEIEDKNTTEYKISVLRSEVHDALLMLIKVDPNGLEFMNKRAQEALNLGDTLLTVLFKDISLSYYVWANDMDGYLSVAFESLELLNKSHKEELPYFQTISQILDALLYAKSEDYELIERMLYEIYESPVFHHFGYTYFIKYLSNLNADSPRRNWVFDLFEVDSHESLIKKLIGEARLVFNDNELIYLLNVSAQSAMNFNMYEYAHELKDEEIRLVKKVYSSELSQAIADHQTKENAREKEIELQQAMQKSKMYFWLVIIIVSALLLILFFAIRSHQRSIKLALRNRENELLIAEKDTLMREIHHRVKNNFELVSALLELQSVDEESENVKNKLLEGQLRIQSLSLIHQKLYSNDNIEEIAAQVYTQELTQHILKSTNLEQTVVAQIQMNHLKLDIDTIIPLGLIINELLTNSCKHAFNAGGNYGVTILLTKLNQEEYQFTYKEDGVKQAPPTTEKKGGFGMLLIRSLVKQLRGTMAFSHTEGANYEIHFKDKIMRKKRD